MMNTQQFKFHFIDIHFLSFQIKICQIAILLQRHFEIIISQQSINQSEFYRILKMSVFPSQNYTDAVIEEASQNNNIKVAIQKIEDYEKEQQKERNQQKRMPCHQSNRLFICINSIVENIYFQVIITIITICSLFMEDFRIIFVDKVHDQKVDVAHIFFISLFFLEICMSLTIPGYACSFFFFLDIVSTLSIGMDVSLLTGLLYQTNSSQVQLSLIIQNSKASRAAARAVRVMKIFRLARVVKLYKSALQTKQFRQKKKKQQIKRKLLEVRLKKMREVAQEESEIDNTAPKILAHDKSSRVNAIDAIHISQIQQDRNSSKFTQSSDILENNKISEDQGIKIRQGQSMISKVLSDSTIKKVIILILLLMFSVPIFQSDNYYQETNAWDFLVGFVGSALQNPKIPVDKINEVIKKNIDKLSELDVYDNIAVFETPFNELIFIQTLNISDLRITDFGISQKIINVTKILEARGNQLTLRTEDITDSISIVMNYKQFNKIDSWFSIVKTLFICVAIVYLLNVFNQSITALIIEPIQKIFNEIKNKGKSENEEQHNENYDHANNDTNIKKNSQNLQNYETVMVYNSVKKISVLLEKIFNSSGRQLIYKKILDKNSFMDSYLNQSKKQFCIFGLCTIENNYELSILLENDYFRLVSEIAQYLHSSAYRYGGIGVSNHGKGLLVAFKSPKYLENIDEIENIDKEISIFADFSIFSMAKTLVKINKQNKFARYRKIPKILKRYQSLQIKINCVLHAGYVYEGFYGSLFKMDYCYLSPCLEQIQKIAYFTHKTANNIFISQNVYNLATKGAKRYCRIVNQINLNKKKQTKGSNSLQLYRVDLNINNISAPKPKAMKSKTQFQSSLNMKREINMEYFKNPKQIFQYQASNFVNSKKQLREVLKNVITEEYRRKYFEAYNMYIKQQWTQCKQILEQLISFNKDDPLLHRIYANIENDTPLSHCSPKSYLDCLIL